MLRSHMARLPFAALVLGACAASSDAGPSPADAASWAYVCDGLRFTMQVEDRAARLTLPDRTILLPQVPAASGVRYRDGTTEFWSKGDTARLELDGRVYADCRTGDGSDPWEAARRRGIDFRAVGQEPGWYLDIDEGHRIELVADYGERRVSAPAPPPSTDDGGRTIYRVRTEAHALTVTILDRPCIDVMSGEAFPATVNVTLDGRDYRGCGRPLGPPRT